MNCSNTREIGFENSHKLIDWWLKRSDEPFLWGDTKVNVKKMLNKINYDIECFIDGGFYSEVHNG